MSSCCIRHVPSGASGGRGLNGLIFFLTRKFHETSVTRSFTTGNAFIGSTVTGFSSGSSLSRVMHISLGIPLTSAEQEPHLPALQFQRHARSAPVRLNIMHRVEHDHALGDFGRVIAKFAAFRITSPDFEGGFHEIDARSVISFPRLHAVSVFSHLTESLAPNLHPQSPNHGLPLSRPSFHFRKLLALFRVIITELCAATFFSFQRRARHRFRNGEQILQIERGVPARIVFTITTDCRPFSPRFKTHQSSPGPRAFRFRYVRSQPNPAWCPANPFAPDKDFRCCFGRMERALHARPFRLGRAIDFA